MSDRPSLRGRSACRAALKKAALRLADTRSSESMVRRRKTHSVLEIPRPWPQRVSWGNGRFWPAILIVWRKGDRLSVTFYPWLHFRRWAFTRCEGCGGRFKWGESPVSTLKHMHAPRTRSVVLGETACYHMDCPPDPRADYGATDGWDRAYGHSEEMRREILREPVWAALELAPLARARRDADQAYRKRLRETREEMGLEEFQWKVPKDVV